MTANYNCSRRKTVRLGLSLNLIFFALFLVTCRQKETQVLGLQWSGKQAVGLRIPQTVLSGNSEQNLESVLQVRLHKSNVPMLGEYTIGDGVILFTPVLPLSPGKQYEVFYNSKPAGSLEVPAPDKSNAPMLVAIYPSADTVPENLLKFYVEFSSPMREGEALRHIHLLDERGDTIPDVFLDLQPELWNTAGTTLTLWVDPGRIKRELIPNQRFGNPLKTGKHYQLLIDSAWKDVAGVALRRSYRKRFFASVRDETSPQPAAWKLDVPIAGSTGPLRIHFNEPLDFFLLNETVQIVNKEGSKIEAAERVVDGEKVFEMVPHQKWAAGTYRIQVASYLEDLAGNNLARLFDRDLTAPQKKDQGLSERTFVIR